jgi:hypothetical protein
MGCEGKEQEMARNIEDMARRLGARIVCQVPNAGGGAFGLARLAAIVAALQARLKAAAGLTKETSSPRK